MTTAYITHPACLAHSNGSFHPEKAERIQAIEDELVNIGFYSYMKHYEAPEATQESLLRVHSAEQIDRVVKNTPTEGVVQIGNEVSLNPFSYKAALHAAGAVVSAVDLIMSGEVNNAFCCVRPPGHHATRETSMGFCIFNNVAVGAAYALDKYNLKRIAIVDFDVHHGNGTEDIFHNDSRVIFCSTFQHPFYPGSGAATSAKNAVNIPIAIGGGREEFRDAVNNHWLPALKKFKPEMIFISAGFDAHRDDNMANLNLKKSDYAWLTKVIKTFAEKCAHGRIVSVLEGGYDLKSLAECVSAHIKVLRGDNNLELKMPFYWRSPEGSVFTLRELNPTDIQRLETFTSELCFQSRYYRFGNGDYKPTEADLAEVCTSNHDKLLHLVVTIMVGGKEMIIGSSRCVINRKKNECEFSLVVADHWQRQGIALRLVESLVRLMKPRGIHKMRAKILDTNLKMLHFVDQLGFKVKAGPKNKWLKIATLTLD